MNRFAGKWEDLEFEDDIDGDAEGKPSGETEDKKPRSLRERLRRK